jgi:hypothetical protein
MDSKVKNFEQKMEKVATELVLIQVTFNQVMILSALEA